MWLRVKALVPRVTVPNPSLYRHSGAGGGSTADATRPPRAEQPAIAGKRHPLQHSDGRVDAVAGQQRHGSRNACPGARGIPSASAGFASPRGPRRAAPPGRRRPRTPPAVQASGQRRRGQGRRRQAGRRSEVTALGVTASPRPRTVPGSSFAFRSRPQASRYRPRAAPRRRRRRRGRGPGERPAVSPPPPGPPLAAVPRAHLPSASGPGVSGEGPAAPPAQSSDARRLRLRGWGCFWTAGSGSMARRGRCGGRVPGVPKGRAPRPTASAASEVSVRNAASPPPPPSSGV